MKKQVFRPYTLISPLQASDVMRVKMERDALPKSQCWIMEALLELMKKKEYKEITVSEIVKKADLGRRTFYRYFKTKDEVLDLACSLLMKNFAQKIKEKQEITLKSVTLSYFEFWNDQTEFLDLMKKAHTLYFLEDRIEKLVHEVAIDLNHVSPDAAFSMDIYYEYIFKLAGFWRITLEWCSHAPRETPEEMAVLVASILQEN